MSGIKKGYPNSKNNSAIGKNDHSISRKITLKTTTGQVKKSFFSEKIDPNKNVKIQFSQENASIHENPPNKFTQNTNNNNHQGSVIKNLERHKTKSDKNEAEH